MLPSELQVVSFEADVRHLEMELSTVPWLRRVDSTVWTGLSASRPISIECDARAQQGVAHVFTQFDTKSDAWRVLLTLGEMPRAIRVTRPVFIGNFITNPKWCVFRPNS